MKKDPEDRIEPDQIVYHPFFSDVNLEDYKNGKFISPLKKLISQINITSFFFDDSKLNKKEKSKNFFIDIKN